MNITKRVEALENKSNCIERQLTEEELERFARAKARSEKRRREQPGFNVETAARMTELTKRRIEELRRALLA